MKRSTIFGILFLIVLLLIYLFVPSRGDASERPTHEKILLNTGGAFLGTVAVVHGLDHLIHGQQDQHIVNYLIAGSLLNCYSISHNTYRDSNGISKTDWGDVALANVGFVAGVLVSDKLFNDRIALNYDVYCRRVKLVVKVD
jgi:hypothetical protein